jgi:PDZ domain-containing protein
MLTTVGQMNANVLTYLWGKATHQDMARFENVHQKGETDQEYSVREQTMMMTSQSSAIQAAYRKLGVPYKVAGTGVLVTKVVEGMPAAGVLQPGDELIEAEGKPVTDGTDLVGLLKSKKAGDTVSITYKRGSATHKAKVALAEFPQDPNNPQPADQAKRVGIGFQYAVKQEIKPDRAKDAVTIKSGGIVGPSAGLMFSLEIINQLTQEDITKGYRIAGTGTITPDGQVGVIGGIQHKIVAADRKKADIFFAPKDLYPQQGDTFQPILNTTDAQNQAKKIRTRMKVVSVGSIDEALAYLKSLPPKG